MSNFIANNMATLLDKIEDNLGLLLLTPHLANTPFAKNKWAGTIEKHSYPTFSRYFPNSFNLVINDENCDKKTEDGVVWYYIKDDVLMGVPLLGIQDIDWTDVTSNNSSLTATSLGGGYYYPSFACPEATFESILGLQMAADFTSLYNRGLFIDFKPPNKFSIKGLANVNYDLKSFVVKLLTQHVSLGTISPTKMETFEALAQADVARYLYMNLRYVDGLETAYVNLDLKLSELQTEADKRDGIIDTLKESYVSTSNDNIPYIWTV